MTKTVVPISIEPRIRNTKVNPHYLYSLFLKNFLKLSFHVQSNLCIQIIFIKESAVTDVAMQKTPCSAPHFASCARFKISTITICHITRHIKRRAALP